MGLVFDGNIQSLGGDYGFDESANRTVGHTATAIAEALQKAYGAQRICSNGLGPLHRERPVAARAQTRGLETGGVFRSPATTPYSHSMVAGGFDDTSYTTRLMPRTSLMMRLDMRPRTS